MHIVSAADDGYVRHYCAMLHSAWLHNPDASHYLLATGIRQENLRLLRDFARKHDIALEVIMLETERTAGLPLKLGLTASTWSRLFIPELLPASVERAIYLDADITVNASLEELFRTDMQGRPVAAVPDRQDMVADEKALLGLDEAAVYFNSGVMLLDLAMWRAERIGSDVLSFARVMDSELILMDQSALNSVLQGRIRGLGKEWNFFDLRQVHSTPHPKIIHHSGQIKPWNSRLSPFRRLYRFHRSLTPWPWMTPLPPQPIKPWIRSQRRRFGAWLGIRRYRPAIEQSDKSQAAVDRIAAAAMERARALLAARA